MSCNCKSIVDLKEQLGTTPTDESIFEFIIRMLKKITFFCIGLLLSVVLIPLILIVVIYNIAFKGKAYFNFSDKFLKKILGIKDGEEDKS